MPGTPLIGREDELDLVETFLDGVAEGPCALVLSGEPGIGKTILWEAGVEEAGGGYAYVLMCRGVEAEASLSFAGLSELLAPVFDEVADSLLPPRRRALEVALLRVEPGEATPDAHAIGLAVLDLLRALAERGPVLVALDDLQWFDPASAGVVQIALRRLRDEQVRLLATVRLGPDLASPVQLDRTFPASRLEQILLGPLSVGAVHTLLEKRLGLELTRPELVRVWEATGGNAFFALELGRELVRTGTRPTRGQALRIPESLQELLGERLGRLPTDTGDVLLQVAALARPTIEVVTRAHGDEARVLEALEAAVHEGVVELDGSNVRFAHPLIASICYEQAPVWKRRAVHRALAASVGDLEERARHLALAADGPDAGVASELEAAAEQAAARGAPAAAGELAEIAAELTPDDPALSRQRRLRGANFYRLAGDLDRAIPMLEQLRTEAPSGVEKADVNFALALTWGPDVTTIIELCDEALAAAADDDARSARLLSFRSVVRLNGADVQTALVDARAALEKAERIGDSALLAVSIARVGQAETWAAEVTPGLLERGVEIEERSRLVLGFNESPRLMLARLLMRRGDVDLARSLLEEREREAAARGHEVTRLVVIWYLSLLEWIAGRWQRALDHATTAQELADQMHHPAQGGWQGRIQALVQADLGLVDEARASAADGLAFSQVQANEAFLITTLAVLGRLELALGNLQAAGDHLRELPGRMLAKGLNDPSQPVWADAIETLIALGELEQARTYLEQYELHARRLGSPLALEGVLRCRGLLAAGEGDRDAAFEAFEGAISKHPEPLWPFERGRTLLCLGKVRRQAGQKKAAREALARALAIFEELGAPLWADKARAELARISGRAPAAEELTETERRVAELAAHGRTNKQIAAELFMGVSTVEAHLSHVYRKLGVRRAELATRLAMPVDEAIEA